MGPTEVPKESSLMLGQWEDFQNLTVLPFLPKTYMEPFALNLSFFPEGTYSSGYVNRNLRTNPVTKLDLQSVLATKCVQALVAENLKR